MQSQLREQQLLEEQVILEEQYGGIHYQEADNQSQGRGPPQHLDVGDGELTELNQQIMNTDLDEGSISAHRKQVEPSEMPGRRSPPQIPKVSDESQMMSVDLSALEAEQEEKERQERTKISRMKTRKSIVRGTPQTKRMIYFNSLNPEVLNRNQPNSNRVRMTKYTLLSWAPLSLFNQFKRISNIYFLIITILTFMPFSPKEPASMLGTFAMVLFFTMLKDAFEDYKRYKQQNEVNKKKSWILKSMLRPTQYPDQMFREIEWEKMQSGQIVMVKKNEDIPADILLLYSSNESGIAFVDTMALDGETNLKEKVTSVDDIHPEMGLNHNLLNLIGTLLCDQPNENLEHWEGILNQPKLSQQTSCSIKNLLIRGSVLKNTDWVVGIVVYSGHDTKIFRNTKASPHKVSNVMKQMNKMLLQVFILQLIIVFISTGMNYHWSYTTMQKHSEIGPSQQDWDNLEKDIIKQIFAFWVTFSHMIPISLYVAIEALKLTQGMLIGQDVLMYDSGETKAFANCKNSDLSEELGQVQMIFSDKTGTLTMNKMELKKFTIDGLKYCEPQDQEDKDSLGMCPSGIKQIRRQLWLESKAFNSNNQSQDTKLLSFFKALALCHTVVCDSTQEHTDDDQMPIYQASSPDELALVQGAQSVGIIFKQRSHSRITLQNMNYSSYGEETFRVVCEFPFDSTRKCMSVLLQDEQTLKYYLYTKGADNVMLEKISFASENKLQASIIQDLYTYSCQGYRTLVIAMKEISQADFEKFERLHSGLQLSTSEYKEKQLTQLYQKMEQGLCYLGSTAIEDKLQEGVPETISSILAAEIRFWVLTGDKLETAIEIAKSCQIIQGDTMTVILQVPAGEPLTPQAVRKVIIQKAKEIRGFTEKGDSGSLRKSRSQKRSKSNPIKKIKNVANLSDFKQENIVIVVEGSTLAVILGTKDLEDRFFQIGLEAKSVICCRVSPKQKADVVQIYKKRGDWVTLSVGDGANDVSMILEANIGVGIRGKEGTQAIRSADYSVSQFRFLIRLLLIHGRLGYIRVSKMILTYFYKNIVLVFAEIPFHFYTGFSGQLFFLDWLPTLYNAVFTSWQCLFAFMYERDINQTYTLKFPLVYKIGQEGRLFTKTQFWLQIFLAFYQGLLCFYLPIYGTNGPAPMTDEGRTYEHWYYSTISFSLILHLVTYKLFVDSSYWNTFSFISGFMGIALFYLVGFVWSINSIANFFHPQLAQMMTMITSDIRFYYLQLLMPILCMIPNLTLNLIKQIFYPEIEHTIMHIQSVMGEDHRVKMKKPGKDESQEKIEMTEGREKLKSVLKRGSDGSPRATMSPKGSDDEEIGRNHGSILPFIPSPQESSNGLYYSRRWGFVSNARICPDEVTDVGSSLQKGHSDSFFQSPFKRSFIVRPFDHEDQLKNSQNKLMLNQDSSAHINSYSKPKKIEEQVEEDIDFVQFSAKKQRQMSQRKSGKQNPVIKSQASLFQVQNSSKLTDSKQTNSSSQLLGNTNPLGIRGRNFGRMLKTQVHPDTLALQDTDKTVFDSALQKIDPNKIAETFNSYSSIPKTNQNLHLQSLVASPSNLSVASHSKLVGGQSATSYVPSLVAITGRVNANKLLEEGHPLESGQRSDPRHADQSSHKRYRRKQKKYVEKYKDLAAVERALINDDLGLFAQPSKDQ